MLTAKGGRTHRRWGKVYFWAMAAVALTAVVLAVWRPVIFLALLAVFSFYSAFSGYRALFRKRPREGAHATAFDWTAAIVTFAASATLAVLRVLQPGPPPPRMPHATGDSVSVRCCIAGGGPAGIMLGLLLARAGVSVLVLEKHADFLRDFRGDTIHPSTLDVMHELGLLDDVLRLPHQEVRELRAQVGEVALPIADFTHLPTRCRFLALMPQWDFLNLLVERATTRYPAFHRRIQVAGSRAAGAPGSRTPVAGLAQYVRDQAAELRAGQGVSFLT